MPGPGSKYAIDRNPYHVAHARAMSTAMWGHAAAVARMTGIPERILQHYMAPQSEKEGPLEKGARIVRALRELGAPNWREPIIALCDEFGGDFIPRPESRTTVTPVAASGALAKESGECVSALLRFAETAQASDAQKALPELDDVIRTAHRARRIAAKAAEVR
jgi:hypothetical protein